MRHIRFQRIGQIGINASLMKDIEAVIFNIILETKSPEDGASRIL
jgi:hypothetical protein